MVDSDYVGIKAAGHDPQFWSDCGPELVQRFIASRAVGDTSCADRRSGGWWVPGSFPTRVADAPAATQTDGPPAPARLRRLATAAAWTVIDSVTHGSPRTSPSTARLRRSASTGAASSPSQDRADELARSA